MTELLWRFLIGGLVVSCFAVIGDLFKPKSFGGLFGAAPSVALATLGLTIAKEGITYSAMEARSMVIGAIALLVYAAVVSRLLMHRNLSGLKATMFSLPLWFAVAFSGWALFLR